MHRDVRIHDHDFDPGAELAALRGRLGGNLGAVATFVGLVRDTRGHAGDPVRTLHLEHYPGMTERSIEAIVAQAETRWPLLDVLVIHRVGSLEPQAQIVYVQIASAHRAAAFAACEFIMDYLKTDAVFWKREDTPDGSAWVEASATDRDRVDAWRRDD